MDVQCDRCKTEYDFDDALVSTRGTTVKCTQCGHQFKVRRDGDASQDRWLVTTLTGQELVFTSLHKLQKAILAGELGRRDLLVRGSGAPRALAAIAELAPFFGDPVVLSGPQVMPATVYPELADPPLSTAPAMSIPAAPALPSFDAPAPARADVASGAARPPEVAKLPSRAPPPRRTETMRISVAPPPSAAALAAAAALARAAELNVAPEPSEAEALALAPGVSASTPSEPVVVGEERTGPSVELRAPDVDPYPSFSSPLPPTLYHAPGAPRVEHEEHEEHEDDLPPATRRRRRVGGWVVVVVVGLGAAATGAAWFKHRPAPEVAATSLSDHGADMVRLERLSKFESALSISDFPAAKKELDALASDAPADARTMVARARLTNRQADLVWLAERAAGDATERGRKRAEMKPWHEALQRDSDAALRAAPTDGGALRTRLDALRMLGERDAARALVARIPAAAGDADTPYILAALDMAEPDPLWPGITDRLRAAAALEPTPGRARAALVLALAASGNASSARLELDRVSENPRLGSLVPALRRYVDKHDDALTAVDAGADAAKVGAGGPMPEDPKRLVAEAAAAIQRGDVERARALYNAALSKNGADSEALAGLGDVERANGNAAKAKDAYRRALQVNPSYLGAMIALGDLEWDGGDRGAALRVYKDISDRFPDSAYPPRVRDRLAASTAATATAAASTAPAAPLPATPTAAPTVAPTDLPTSAPPPPLPPPTAKSTEDSP